MKLTEKCKGKFMKKKFTILLRVINSYGNKTQYNAN